MDYETFGEHQWESTGIFEFMRVLPEMIFRHPHWDFKTPSEVITDYPEIADISFPRITSWADMERDITAWRGNRMQTQALQQCYELGEEIRWQGDSALFEAWRKLQTSDHFYYMCTKWFADGDVHAYFSPYSSPYDAFINYVNVLRDFRRHILERSHQRSSEPVLVESAIGQLQGAGSLT
jgi:alpha-amylase